MDTIKIKAGEVDNVYKWHLHDLVTKDEMQDAIDDAITGGVDLSEFATHDEVNEKIISTLMGGVDLSEYPKKEEVNEQVNQAKDEAVTSATTWVGEQNYDKVFYLYNWRSTPEDYIEVYNTVVDMYRRDDGKMPTIKYYTSGSMTYRTLTNYYFDYVNNWIFVTGFGSYKYEVNVDNDYISVFAIRITSDGRCDEYERWNQTLTENMISKINRIDTLASKEYVDEQIANIPQGGGGESAQATGGLRLKFGATTEEVKAIYDFVVDAWRNGDGSLPSITWESAWNKCWYTLSNYNMTYVDEGRIYVSGVGFAYDGLSTNSNYVAEICLIINSDGNYDYNIQQHDDVGPDIHNELWGNGALATKDYVQEQIANIQTGGGGEGGGSSTPSSPLLEGNKIVCFHIKNRYEWNNFWEVTVQRWLDNPLVTSLKLNGKEITENMSSTFYESERDVAGNVAIVEVEFNTGDLSLMGTYEYMGVNLGNAVVLGTGITKVPELFFHNCKFYYVYQCAPEIVPSDDGMGYVYSRGWSHENGGYPIVWYLPNRDQNGGSVWDYNHEYSNGVTQRGRGFGYEYGIKVAELPVTNVVSVVQHAYINIKGMAERFLWLDDIKKALEAQAQS